MVGRKLFLSRLGANGEQVGPDRQVGRAENLPEGLFLLVVGREAARREELPYWHALPAPAWVQHRRRP